MRSFINPNVINKNSETIPASFSTFMSGRKEAIGSSVLNSARNNIVNFNRNRLTPISSNIPQVLSNISTNVTNNSNNVTSITQKITQNVNNSVSNIVSGFKEQSNNLLTTIQKRINTTLDNLIKNFTKDYQKRVQSLENSRPFEIVKKFLSLYKNAIDFISFFSNEKNIKRIQSALRTLRRIFDESFNVALVIRQIINKIVRQLSNLPTASGNAPDLNLDLKVPGGQLKQAGSRLPRMARNIALVGAGVAGTVATQQLMGGMGKAQQIQEEKLKQEPVSKTQGESMMPEGLIEGLERIVDNFSNAVSALIEFAKKKPTSSTTSGASPAAPPPPGEPDSVAPPGGLPEAYVSPEIQTTGLKSNFSPIAQDILESGLIDPSKLSDRAALAAMMAVGQMESNFPYRQAYSGLGGSGMNMQGFLQLNRAYNNVQGEQQYLQRTVPVFKGESPTFTGKGKFNPLVFAERLQRAETGWDVAQALTAGGFTRNDFDPLDTPGEANRLQNVEAIKRIAFGDLNFQVQSRQGVTGIQTSRTGATSTSPSRPSPSSVTPSPSTARPPTAPPPPSGVMTPPPPGRAVGGKGNEQASTNIINLGGSTQQASSSVATQSAAAEGGQTDIAFLPPDDSSAPYSYIPFWAYNINNGFTA